jgi:hypothetical protein
MYIHNCTNEATPPPLKMGAELWCMIRIHWETRDSDWPSTVKLMCLKNCEILSRPSQGWVVCHVKTLMSKIVRTHPKPSQVMIGHPRQAHDKSRGAHRDRHNFNTFRVSQSTRTLRHYSTGGETSDELVWSTAGTKSICSSWNSCRKHLALCWCDYAHCFV